LVTPPLIMRLEISRQRLRPDVVVSSSSMPADEMTLRSGDGPTTRIGYVNANRQKCHGFGVYAPITINTHTGSVPAMRLCLWRQRQRHRRAAVPAMSGGVDGIQHWLPDISPKAFKLTDK
jgi:hypothetical protein